MPFIITNEKIIIVLCFQEISQNPKVATVNKLRGRLGISLLLYRALEQEPGRKGEKQKRKAFKLEHDEVTALHR